MRWIAAALLVLLALIMVSSPASACTFVPWEFPRYTAKATAVLHGRVTHLRGEGSQATLEVLTYAGPGDAPAVVTLPRTRFIDGQGVCPDIHFKFQQGEAYLVFLADLPPNLQYADDWRLALVVDQAGAVRDNFSNPKPAAELLAEFAAERGIPVQVPERTGPRWRPPVSPAPWLRAAGAVVLLGLVLLVWRRTRTH